MNRSIAWQQTGGRTHRVTITEDRLLTAAELQGHMARNSPMMGYYTQSDSLLAYNANALQQSNMAQEAHGAEWPYVFCGRGGIFGGLF